MQEDIGKRWVEMFTGKRGGDTDKRDKKDSTSRKKDAKSSNRDHKSGSASSDKKRDSAGSEKKGDGSGGKDRKYNLELTAEQQRAVTDRLQSLQLPSDFGGNCAGLFDQTGASLFASDLTLRQAT